MAELADALDLGSSGATRTGSIPASCTNLYLSDDCEFVSVWLQGGTQVSSFCWEAYCPWAALPCPGRWELYWDCD